MSTQCIRDLDSSTASCFKFQPLQQKQFEKTPKYHAEGKVPDTKVLQRAGIHSMHILKLHSWDRLAMSPERLPAKPLLGVIEVGNCSQDGQEKRCEFILKNLSLQTKHQHTVWVLGRDRPWPSNVAVPHQVRNMMITRQRESATLRESTNSGSPEAVHQKNVHRTFLAIFVHLNIFLVLSM